VLDDSHAIVGDSMEEQNRGAVGMRGADSPAVKEPVIRRADVKRFAVYADLPERGISLLDKVGRERAAGRMKETRSHEPAKNYGDKRRREEQN